MSDPFAHLRRFLRELKRRNVYKVAVAYLAVAFVGLQAARLLVPATTLPGWADELLIYIAVFGFPIALVVAWAFELTPEGVRRTADAEGASDPESMSPGERRAQSRLAMTVLVGLGLVGAAVAGGWYLMGGGGEPSAETTASADTAHTEPRLGDRSIAVLPFEALGQQEPDAFTEGVHDDLLARLSNILGLKVISRTAVQQYRDTDLSTGEVADSLGVRWVMEGGVQEMGDQIQVNAQLIDPRTETHAWAESYRRDLTAEGLFALQSDITKRIARSLEAELTPEETERVERRPTEDLDAYRLYVQGRGLLDQRQPEAVRKSVEYFGRALRQDSTYALAWSGLADALVLQKWIEFRVPSDAPAAGEAARRAVQLDPDLAEGHASLGLVLANEFRGPAALRELKRAVTLKPSYAQAQHWLGMVLLLLGQEKSALEALRRAVELNPQHGVAHVWLASAYLANGQVERALRTARQQGRDRTNLDAGVRALLRQERFDDARRFSRRGESCCGESLFTLGMIDVAAGDTTAARERLDEMGQGEAGPIAVGLVEAAMGRLEAAFESFQEAEFSELSRGTWTLRVRYHFPELLAPFRKDPRFGALVRDLNVAWGLNPDGSIPDSVDVSFDPQADE